MSELSGSVDRARLKRAAKGLWRGRSKAALVAVAHPDDAEISFGATMLKLVETGWRVYVLVATDGRASGADTRLSPAALVRQRRAEQRRAAALAGLSAVFFLDLPDGEAEFHKRRLTERLIYFLRRLRPSALYTFDPTTVYFTGHKRQLTGPFQHPDHRAVGDAALAAVYCGSSLPRVYPRHAAQGLREWAVDDVYLACSLRPNHREDLRRYSAGKRRLIRVYESQAGASVQLAALNGEAEPFRRIRCVPSPKILEGLLR